MCICVCFESRCYSLKSFEDLLLKNVISRDVQVVKRLTSSACSPQTAAPPETDKRTEVSSRVMWATVRGGTGRIQNFYACTPLVIRKDFSIDASAFLIGIVGVSHDRLSKENLKEKHHISPTFFSFFFKISEWGTQNTVRGGTLCLVCSSHDLWTTTICAFFLAGSSRFSSAHFSGLSHHCTLETL